MKKYMILALLPVLVQGALHGKEGFHQEMHQVMHPAIQDMKHLLKHPMISNVLDDVLNALLEAVKKGTVGKDAAIAKIEDLKKVLENFKAKQYPNYFMSFFMQTPHNVRFYIQPTIDKVNKVLAELNNNQMSVGAIVGLGLATAGVAIGGSLAAMKVRDVLVLNSMDSGIQEDGSSTFDAIAARWATVATEDAFYISNSQTKVYEYVYSQALQSAKHELEHKDRRFYNKSDNNYKDASTKAAKTKAKKAVLKAANKAHDDFVKGHANPSAQPRASQPQGTFATPPDGTDWDAQTLEV